MAKWRFLLAACAILAMSGPALAKPLILPHEPSGSHPTEPEPDAQVTSRISDINADTRSITLADGYHFKIPAWISFDQLKNGEMVSVVYTPNPHQDTMTVKTISII